MMRTWLVLGVLAAFAGIVIDAQARAPGPPQGVTIKNPNDPSLDMTAPTVTISTPTSGTTHDAGTDTTLASLAGTSADASGIASCQWVNNLGGSGNATTSGAGGWAVSNLALTVGSNVLTVTCLDPGNNAGTDVLTVTRSSAVADGAHIWVDTDGGTCVDNASPVVYNTTTACGTIAAAAATSDAGDLVRVKAGTYSEVVTESTNGSAGNTITFVADGAVTMNGFVIDGDYVRVIGFTIECGNVRDSGVILQNSDNVEIWNNTIQNCEDESIRTDTGTSTLQSNNSIFLGNKTIHSAFLDYQLRGNNNLVAYHESNIPEIDFLYIFGNGNRILNNYSHDLNAAAGLHTDFLQSGADALGLGQTLYEANFYADTPNGDGGDHHCMNIEDNGTDAFTIFRRNIWSSNDEEAGGQCFGIGNNYTFTRIYHEVIAYQTSSGGSGCCFAIFGGSPVSLGLLNNIWHQAWFGAMTSVDTYGGSTPAVNNYQLFYDTGGSVTFVGPAGSEANSQRNVNPVFVNPAAPTLDFRLQSGSPARDAGSALTTTSGSGTGTTFNVASGGGSWFRGANTNLAQYGGKLAEGDWITVGTDLVQIASISTDAITVTASFTWANAEPVYIGDDTTPDLGVYPYKAGGYTLSATYAGSSTKTITPNDASLVRYVICYDSGVPYEVDTTSPYTCTAATGTFSARVYPLYPSKILWAVATP